MVAHLFCFTTEIPIRAQKVRQCHSNSEIYGKDATCSDILLTHYIHTFWNRFHAIIYKIVKMRRDSFFSRKLSNYLDTMNEGGVSWTATCVMFVSMWIRWRFVVYCCHSILMHLYHAFLFILEVPYLRAKFCSILWKYTSLKIHIPNFIKIVALERKSQPNVARTYPP